MKHSALINTSLGENLIALRTYPVHDRYKISDEKKTGAELPSLFLASVEWRYLSYVDKVEMML